MPWKAEGCGVLGKKKIPQIQFLLLWHTWVSLGILRTRSHPGILFGMLLFPGVQGVNTNTMLLLGRVGNVLCSSQTHPSFPNVPLGLQELSPWICWICAFSQGCKQGKEGMWNLCTKLWKAGRKQPSQKNSVERLEWDDA